MASVADLFKLGDGSSYQNTLAQMLQMMNQYENRGVQREGQAIQASGQAMDYDAKVRGQMSAEGIANQTDQRERMKQAQDMGYKYDELGERRENNTGERQIAQQNADAATQNADTNRMKASGDLFFAGNKDAREQGEYGMKQYDWQESKAHAEALGQALQKGGVEEYTRTLGKLGMTKEYMDAQGFIETRNRNAYLNQATYLDSVKVGKEIEVGSRVREGYDIAMQYNAIAAKDPELADQFLPQALNNSKYYKEMGALPIETTKIMFPSSFVADGMSLGKNSSDPSFLRANNKLYKGFTGAESPFGNGDAPTNDMQNAQAMVDNAGTPYGEALKQQTKKVPAVQIGPDGEQISGSTTAMKTEDQKQLAAGTLVENRMNDIVNTLSDPDKAKYLLGGQQALTAGSTLLAGQIPEDKLPKWMTEQIKGSKGVTTELGKAAFEEVLRIAATTFTQGIVDKIKVYAPSADDDPISARTKAEKIRDIIRQENEVRRSRLEAGGQDVGSGGLSKLSDAELAQVKQQVAAKKERQNIDNLYQRKLNPEDVAALARARGYKEQQ